MGRPKGAKNKKTLAAEALIKASEAAEEAALAATVGGVVSQNPASAASGVGDTGAGSAACGVDSNDEELFGSEDDDVKEGSESSAELDLEPPPKPVKAKSEKSLDNAGSRVVSSSRGKSVNFGMKPKSAASKTPAPPRRLGGVWRR